MHQRASSPVAALRQTSEGKIITVFSPKGGVGKTVLACGLATQLARKCERRALLLDLDLQFGDAAIMMGIEPEKTIYDLVMTTGELDTEKLAGYVTTHPSGVDLVPAPVRPEDAELVAEERVARLLDVAKESYDAIVVDTPAFFQATDAGDARPHRAPPAGRARSTSPRSRTSSSRCRRSTCSTTPRTASTSCSTASGGKGELKRSEVEKALDLKVSFELPERPRGRRRRQPRRARCPSRRRAAASRRRCRDMAEPARRARPQRGPPRAPARSQRGRGRRHGGKRQSVKLRKAA